MHLITRNVNTAFRDVVSNLDSGVWPTRLTDSRNGPVLVVDEPVTVTYTHPRERVLFNQSRDANPFFHLYESLWMLAGRNDVESVAYYAKQMREYSDNGKTLNGAYGYRWRNGPYLGKRVNYPRGKADQLELIINHLKTTPNSRRAVLQMWNVEDDLLKIGAGNCTCTKTDGTHYPGCRVNECSKDVCCNTQAYFSVRTEHCSLCRNSARLQPSCSRCDSGKLQPDTRRWLDMTVTNRSNDLTWGMLGANAVHFSVLLEYMATMIGVEVGVYNHVTNNLHVYLYRWHPYEWLKEYEDKGASDTWYELPEMGIVPMVKNPADWDHKCRHATTVFDGAAQYETTCPGNYAYLGDPFLDHTFRPMCMAWQTYKRKAGDWISDVVQWLGHVHADDWRTAGMAWMQRRFKKHEREAGASAG